MNDTYLYSDQATTWELGDAEARARVKSSIIRTRDAARTLTPAGQRLLIRLHRVFEETKFKPVDRVQIAAVLGRPHGLSLWDRRLLEHLCKVGFISCHRVALPTYIDKHGIKAGRGYRYVYSMKIDIGWRLFMLRNKKKDGANRP